MHELDLLLERLFNHVGNGHILDLRLSLGVVGLGQIFRYIERINRLAVAFLLSLIPAIGHIVRKLGDVYFLGSMSLLHKSLSVVEPILRQPGY